MLEGTPDNLAIGPFRHVIDIFGEQLVQRCSDSAWLDQKESSGEYRGYLRWVAAGNVPEVLDYRNPEDSVKVTVREASEALERSISNG